MSEPSGSILIIGAGPGGLCLAHGLLAHGIEAHVFERDTSPSDRSEGYRLGINATGRDALKACLPKERYDELLARSAKPSQAVTFLDQRLRRLLGVELAAQPATAGADASDHPISRNVLRRVLSEGLDGHLHFGKKLVAFEPGPDASVRARFEDGSDACGRLLVGADGAGSRVRQQLLPHAKRIETGIQIVTGKFALFAGVRARTPAAIWRGPTLVMGPDGRFLFANAVEYPQRAPAEDGASSVPPHPPAPGERDEYVMWGFSAWKGAFPAAEDVATLAPADLKSSVLGMMQGWHPKLRYLIERVEVSSVRSFAAQTSVPIDPWQTTHVTLLGDALHNMTPYRGVGANTALYDAALLTRALVDVRQRQVALLDAVAGYERQMITHGFEAVRASLHDMTRLHDRSPWGRLATKISFRAADRVQPLKALFHAAH